jgi:hypothetical protein
MAPEYGLTRDRYHRYTANYSDWSAPVGPVPGVTTPLKIQETLNGGNLASWGGGIAADYVLRMAQEGPIDDGDDFAMRVKARALAKVDEARDIGSAVHARVEHILLNEAAPRDGDCPRHPREFGRPSACQILPELVPPYLDAFASFLAAKRPEFVLVEAMIFNVTHRYAGTLDIGCILNKRRALIDVKTGKAKESHRLQLAALAAGEFIGQPGDDRRYPVPRFQDFYTLLLSPTGWELVAHDVTRRDRAHFFHLVRTYARLREWAGKDAR